MIEHTKKLVEERFNLRNGYEFDAEASFSILNFALGFFLQIHLVFEGPSLHQCRWFMEIQIL